MNNNIFSDALWWLRSRDKGALIFVGILAALLLVLLIYAFARGNGTSDDAADFVVSETPATPVPTAVALATVAAQATIPIPTAIPTAAPTPALTTDDLVAGADNADQVGTDDQATADEPTAVPEPTATAVPAAAASPTNTPVPAAATEVPTPTPSPTPSGPPEPSPTPCIIGSGGFCIRPGEAPPATQATPVPTALPTTPTATPTADEMASGSINQSCGADGSLVLTFSATNPETATGAISVLPLISNNPDASPAAFVVPADDSLTTSITLTPGYLVGEASLFIDQSPVSTVQLNDCTPALVG